MNPLVLIVYSRHGCCLCEGLEERLQSLPLHQLNPPLKLHVIDIDGGDISESQRSRYDLAVPVMVLASFELKHLFDLPRASPRLNKEALLDWLQKVVNKGIELGRI